MSYCVGDAEIREDVCRKRFFKGLWMYFKNLFYSELSGLESRLEYTQLILEDYSIMNISIE